MDPKDAITYKILKVGCSEAIRDDDLPGRIEVTIGEILVGDKTTPSHCEVGQYCEPITFYLNEESAKAHGIPWKGTWASIREVRSNLEGKRFILDLGIKP